MIVDGNNFISHHLKKGIPFAAGKLGGNELQLLYVHLTNTNPWGNLFIKEVEDVAGLYPATDDNIKWFAETVLADLHQVDLLPAWSKVIPDFESHIFSTYCPESYITKLQHLEPYFFETPWTKYLEGKKVAVFSPFADSIKKNYIQLEKIWDGKIMPNFTLEVVNYPVSLALGKNNKYKTSRDVYQEYIEKIHSMNFDVGIFGTGHTGLLFAIECKKLNRTGIHLGGPTQILFGVKGNRWEENTAFHSFFNESWTRPMSHETPTEIHRVEGACYW